MQEKNLFEPLFPSDFDCLNSRYEKFRQVLNAIDYEIDNSRKDKGPSPAPVAPDKRPFNLELRRKRIEFLERTRDRRVKGFKTEIEKEIATFDEKQKGIIISRLNFETSRNGFKEYTKDDLKSVEDFNKQDTASFDYMAAQHFSKYQHPDKAGLAGEKENMDVWTDRYLNLINEYHGYGEVQDVNEPEIDKD